MRGQVLLTAGLVVAAVPKPPNEHPSGHRIVDSISTVRLHAIEALCPGDSSLAPDQLIARQGRLADAAANAQGALLWRTLGCTDAVLFARDIRGQPPGASWAPRAISALEKALDYRAADERAATVLGIIAVDRAKSQSGAAGPSVFGPDRFPVGKPAWFVYRAVINGARGARLLQLCVSLTLDIGDYTSAHDCGIRALAAGTDSTWHMLRLAYIAALRGDTAGAAAWFRGAVASAHDSTARLAVAWHLDQWRRNPAVRDKGDRLSAADHQAMLEMPDSEYRRWVFRRWASLTVSDSDQADWDLPDSLRAIVRDSAVVAAGRGGTSLVHRLILHFWNVAYAGDAFRQCVVWVPSFKPCAPTRSDGFLLRVMTQSYRWWRLTDGRPIRLVSYAIPVKDLALGHQGDSSMARVNLTYWWSLPEAHTWADSAVQLHLVFLPDANASDRSVAGLFLSSLNGATSGWALTAVQPTGRRGGNWEDLAPPEMRTRPLELSDIILGVPNRDPGWTDSNTVISVSPVRAFDRWDPVEFSLEAKTDFPRAKVTVTITVARASQGPAGTAIHIASPLTLSRGLNVIQRSLDFRSIGTGTFEVSVSVDDPSTGESRTRNVVVSVQ